MQLQSGYRSLLQQLGKISIGLTVASGTAAAEWTTSAGVAPAIEYTDNVCLSKDNKQDEWIALVTPSAGVAADGNNANFDISGSVEFNSLSDGRLEDLGCNGSGRFGGNREQFAPRLTGTADAILLEQWLFIDATTNIYQNEVTPFASGGGDSLNRTGNTNTTYDYTISPYLLHRFKDAAEVSLRYTWDDQYNSQDVVGDSSEQSVAFLLSSVPEVSKLSWGIQGDYSKTSYSDNLNSVPGLDGNNDDSELKSAQFNLAYQLNRYWQVNGFVGNEWNDFVSSRDDIDGDYWDAGFRWTPNERTSVEAGNGNRFFGNSPRFSVSHRHKRSTFDAGYSKELTYDRDIRALGSDQPSGGINPGQTTFARGPTLDERFTLGYAFEGRRFGFGFNAFQSEQTREEQRTGSILDDTSKTKYRGVSANADHSLSRNLSLSTELSWNEQQPEDVGNDIGFVTESEEWIFGIGVQRQLGLNTSLSFDYTYTDRQSDNTFDEYTENNFILTLRIDL